MEKHFRKYKLRLGTDVETGEPVSLGLERVSEHIHITGPTGVGKTRSTILPWFMRLCSIPDATVILVGPKGDLCPLARDWAIGHGYAHRLINFDPGQAPLLGFNPLKRNGWAVARHAKMVRGAIAASRGQHSFDQTPQLQRLLFLTLAVALEQQMTLIEAFRLLQPGRSAFRRELLNAVQDEFLRECLQWYEDLKEARREELGASTLARLENFISDPLIRAILTEEERSLDIGDVLRRHQILIINLEFYRPLSPDDVSTLARLLLNSILAHVFARPKEKRSPVFLLIDEVQEFATEDLARALTLGRELGLGCVIAHQFPSQLKLSADNSHLFEAVQHCCRTKVVFGGMHTDELETITKETFIDQYNPWSVKNELTTLECEPIESKRSVLNFSVSRGTTSGHTHGTAHSVAHGDSAAKARSWGSSRTTGTSITQGSTSSYGSSSGYFEGAGAGETMLPSGEMIETASDTSGSTGSDSWSQTDINSQTTLDTIGEHQASSESKASSESEARSTSDATTDTANSGEGYGVTLTPYTEYKKRRIVSSRTFLTQEEFLTLCLQKVKAQPRGHYVIKVPDKKAVFIRAPFVRLPWVSNAVRERALERIASSFTPAIEAVPSRLAIRAEGTHAPRDGMLEFSEAPPSTFLDET